MSALRMKKNSAFLAYQLASSDLDSDGSDSERREEHKNKQKAKKKSRAKKKNSDSAVLKDLAMCAVSKPKKSKGKAKAGTTTPPPEPDTAAAVVGEPIVPVVEEKPAAVSFASKVAAKPKPSEAANQAAAPAPKTAAKAVTPPAAAQSPPKTNPTPAPSNGPGPPSPPAQQQNGADLGAVYSPTHVKITRVDGQMTRTIAVSEMMDQLYLFGHQNTQLRIVQEQLTVANHQMQERLQRDAEIINSLQNEVTMFRQMCLNLQAEVSMYRSSSTGAQSSLSSSDDINKTAHRPPPGM
uniref:Uncharacterized protein n=1 Tax=Globisporangium ultimum (strain ATCC 200006 / CBS 805.95 / DAOM BR144) TaxID=431595 RepID=K3W9U2_GLOUD